MPLKFCTLLYKIDCFPCSQSARVRKWTLTFVLIVLWFIVSTIKGNSSKYILQRFSHPLTLSMCHFTATALLSFPLLYFMGLRTFKIPAESWRQFFLFIVPMAALKTFGTASGHLALWKISVPYSQTIRASTPIFTVVISRIFLGVKQRVRVYMSLVVIVTGVAVASYTESSFNLFGMAFGIAATCSQSVQNIVNKTLMSGEQKIHSFELLGILGRIAFFLIIPIWAFVDGEKLIELSQRTEYAENWWVILLLIIVDSTLNFLQNVVAFSVLNLITPTSYAVANASKRVFIIVFGIILFSTPVSILNGLGMFSAVFGVFLYSYFRIQNKNVEKKQEPLEKQQIKTETNPEAPEMTQM